MPLILFKSCPRCHGDVEEVTDPRGFYRQCIQCGWVDWLLGSDAIRTEAGN